MAGNFHLGSYCFHNFLITELLSPNSTANPSAKCSLLCVVVATRFADLQHVVQRRPRKHSTILPFTPKGAQGHFFGVFQLLCAAQWPKAAIKMISFLATQEFLQGQYSSLPSLHAHLHLSRLESQTSLSNQMSSLWKMLVGGNDHKAALGLICPLTTFT